MHYYSDGPISIARGLLRRFFARDLLSNAAKKRAKVHYFFDLCKFFGKKMYFFLLQVSFLAIFPVDHRVHNGNGDALD